MNQQNKQLRKYSLKVSPSFCLWNENEIVSCEQRRNKSIRKLTIINKKKSTFRGFEH